MEIEEGVRVFIELVGSFAMIASLTPNSSDNAAIDVVLRVINALGANLGKARNR